MTPARHVRPGVEAALGASAVAAGEHAIRLLAEVAGPLGIEARDVLLPQGDDPAWPDLTGYAQGPPAWTPPGPVDLTRAALGIIEAYTHAKVPGVELLTERARVVGLRRNAPFSPGGAFRMLPAMDGWFGLSLARPADVERLPALLETHVRGDKWVAVTRWLRSQTSAEAEARARLLSLPAAAVPPSVPAPRRPSVVVTPGGGRAWSGRPLIADLTSLWAGPLCARLLRLGGARVIKVEGRQRPDGARAGPWAFFELMHRGSQFRMVDFTADSDELAALIRSADVVLEGSRPRALRQLGFDASELVARGAIWASITAYGRGPGDDMRVGFGDDVAAGAGLVSWVDGVPLPVGDALADPLAGVTAAAAIAMALQSDRAALLDVSMHDVAVHAAQ